MQLQEAQMPASAGRGPRIPMCKLAEYCVTPSAVRRRSLVRAQIKNELGGPHRWWYSEARAAIKRFFADPDAHRSSLKESANELRDLAAAEADDERRKGMLASARALEAFAPIADAVRVRNVVATPVRRDDGRIRRGAVKVIVAPDILFLEKGTERVVGGIQLHASQSHSLDAAALQIAAAILHAYFVEHGEHPKRDLCRVVDLFVPSFEATPRALARRMELVNASCDEIEQWWAAMYESVKAEVAAAAARRARRR